MPLLFSLLPFPRAHPAALSVLSLCVEILGDGAELPDARRPSWPSFVLVAAFRIPTRSASFASPFRRSPAVSRRRLLCIEREDEEKCLPARRHGPAPPFKFASDPVLDRILPLRRQERASLPPASTTSPELLPRRAAVVDPCLHRLGPWSCILCFLRESEDLARIDFAWTRPLLDLESP